MHMKHLELVERKSLPNGEGYVFRTYDHFPVLASSITLDDKEESINKWKIKISLESGCPVGCVYCFTKGFQKHRQLTVDEIAEQVDFIYSSPGHRQRDFDQVKVEMKEMGDPTTNAQNTCNALRKLAADYNGLLYVVSTAGVRNFAFFDQLREVRDGGVDVRLQFSCHSTSNKDIIKLSPLVRMLTLEERASLVSNWYDGKNKVTLNFVPFRGYELFADKIIHLFNPEEVFVKVSYTDINPFTQQAGLENASYEDVQHFVQELQDASFQVAYRNHTPFPAKKRSLKMVY